MRPKLRRPSPATLIALLALFVALGGTSYAALRITGREVVNRSLTWRDVHKESLGSGEIHNLRGRDLRPGAAGGREVNEATLGTVPRATSANGFTPRKVFARIPRNSPEQTILSAQGMSLLASCPNGTVQIRAVTTASNSELAADSVANNNDVRGVRAGDFDVGESVDIDQGAANGHATLSFANAFGGIVTANLGFGSGSAFGGSLAGCAVYGTALGG